MDTTKVTYEINRSRAICAGKAQYGRVEHEVEPSDLTPDQREELAGCPVTSGGASIVDAPNGHMEADIRDAFRARVGEVIARLAEPGLDTVRAILDARSTIRPELELAHQRELQAAHEARVHELLATPPSPDGQLNRHGEILHTYPPSVWDDPRLAEWRAQVEAASAARQEQLRAARRAERERQAAEAAAEQADAARRSAAIARWVETHGDDSHRGRAALGLLPDGEVIAAIRDEAFAAIDIEIEGRSIRYTRMTDADVSHTPACREYTDELGDESDPDISYTVRDLQAVSAAQWTWIDLICRADDRAAVRIRRHSATCNACGGNEIRDSLYVSIQADLYGHTWTFSREYDLPDHAVGQ